MLTATTDAPTGTQLERLARWTLAAGDWRNYPNPFDPDDELWLEGWEYRFHADDIEAGDLEQGVTLAEAFADELHVREVSRRWLVDEVDRLRAMQREFGICEAVMRDPHRVTRWDRSRLKAWLVGKAYRLGIVGGYSTTHPDWHVCTIRWRGSRPYVLGVQAEWWQAFRWCVLKRLRRGERPHWPSMVPGWGCGKCCPWQCCGAIGWEHREGCTDA